MRKFGGFWLKKLFNWNSSFSTPPIYSHAGTAPINARFHYPGLRSRTRARGAEGGGGKRDREKKATNAVIKHSLSPSGVRCPADEHSSDMR